jgi:hypothetical protein
VIFRAEPEQHELEPRSEKEVAQRNAPTVQAQRRRRRKLTLQKRLLMAGIGLLVGLTVWALLSGRSQAPGRSQDARQTPMEASEQALLPVEETDAPDAPAKVDIEDLTPDEASEPGRRSSTKANKERPARRKGTKKSTDSNVRDFGF